MFLTHAVVRKAQNPLDTFPCSFTVDLRSGSCQLVANLLSSR